MPFQTLVLATLVAAFCAGCVAGTASAPRGTGEDPRVSPAQPSPEPAPQAESALVQSLIRLADGARARGDLDLAESRYRRALAADPNSSDAWIGLVAIFLASEREDEASALVARVVETATGPARADALVLLAEVQARTGRGAAASQALAHALELDDDNYQAHQRLADLTGLAPVTPARDEDAALQRARDHPYDPTALVAGARVLAARGDEVGAVEWLENAVWLADVDGDSSRAAAALLRQIDAHWGQRKVVWVHVYADESVRGEAGWRMRMRLVWRSVSISLDHILRVAFVPITLDGFRSAGSRADLQSIRRARDASGKELAASGLLAILTDRPVPRRRGIHRRGQAAFLGRELVVRLTPGEILSRTLIHEILHIYGGVHVSAAVESLMNPSGDSQALDLGNQAIAWLLRDRRFGPGGMKANVIPYTDVDGLITAYFEMLRVNLGLRRKGMKAARIEVSRFVAAGLRKKAVELDSHLGDVARTTGYLLAESGHPIAAAELLGSAARLYGLDSERGQSAIAIAERLLGAYTERP